MDFIREEVMEQKRTTPEFITSLEPNEIFVFGSNLKGMHGGGAAYIAYRKFGAIMGKGVGLQGQSYAIPTMQGGVETIRPYVDEFIWFAKQHPLMMRYLRCLKRHTRLIILCCHQVGKINKTN